MTRSTIFAATAAGGMVLTAATLALTPDIRPRWRQAPQDELAAVTALLTAARGANPVMCALAARSSRCGSASTLVTPADPRRSQASAVEYPVPVPTSRTVCPSRTSASAHIRTTSDGSVEDEVGAPP